MSVVFDEVFVVVIEDDDFEDIIFELVLEVKSVVLCNFLVDVVESWFMCEVLIVELMII